MKVHQLSGFSGGIKLWSLSVWTVVYLVGIAMPGLLWAKETTLTPDVVGFKPVANNVVIDNPSPTLGDTLNVTYDYVDEDGDAEATPGIKWLYNGEVVAREVGASYTPALNTNTGTGNSCGDFQVTAEITPTSQTGDPLTGDIKQSPPVTLSLPTIPGFTFPETTVRNWSDANIFCQAQGMALPTSAQLQAVFNNYTSGTNHYQLLQNYGWPMYGGRCGGSSTSYWTSEVASGSGSRYHNVVSMFSGTVGVGYETSGFQVTCTLPPPPGSAPVVSAVSFNAPVANVDVTATWEYTDADGDVEAGTAVEWLADDAVVGTGNPLKGVGMYATKNLSVRITPRAATGSPASTQNGAPVTSSAQVVMSTTIGNFTQPAITSMASNEADTYCKAMTPAARLPTRAELANLFNSSTSGGTNYEMCNVYGWPMYGGNCGGTSSTYWTSDVSDNVGYYYGVNMNSNIVSQFYYTSQLQVTCVR
ncbi:hypothetical protein ACUVMQ_21245 [Aeromonas veronii]|uniref:hypothetical protein n=1 Tax=Aeromonas veronii TaxID=654 RepID=UPI00405598B8